MTLLDSKAPKHRCVGILTFFGFDISVAFYLNLGLSPRFLNLEFYSFANIKALKIRM
jgi:hypothetical protein